MTASLGLHVMLLQTIDVQFLATRALPEVVKWEAAPVRRLWRQLFGRRTSWRHKLDRRARRLGERVKRSHSSQSDQVIRENPESRGTEKTQLTK